MKCYLALQTFDLVKNNRSFGKQAQFVEKLSIKRGLVTNECQICTQKMLTLFTAYLPFFILSFHISGYQNILLTMLMRLKSLI